MHNISPRLGRRAFGRLLAGAAMAAPAIRRVRADEPLRLRCSLDTAPSHGRNISMTDYLQKLEKATDGRIKGEVFSSGQLYPDLEVGKALIQGQVEMACPGTWTITGIVPDADVFQLPVLYGRTLDDVHKLIDGQVGAKVNADIAQKLRSQVIGHWLDLGYQNWYSASKPLASLADLKGMKIRNSGGAGQAWRARFVGAIPNTTAWPNVPLALSQGTFDGLVSTNESVATAKLWDSGREIRARGPSVRRRIHPDGEPRVLEEAHARPAEDHDGSLGAEHPDLPRRTWRQRRPRRGRRSNPTA